jgi:nucleotide-binding universal stress UspA family protein
MSKPRNTRFEVGMVGLDLTEMDHFLINYVKLLMKTMPLKRILFVHIAKELELPKELTEKYPDLLAPLDENIADGISKKIAPLFEDSDVDYDVIVREGQPFEQFLRLSKIKNVDLIVLGRKRSLKGSGLLAGSIVSKSPVSILFVPERNFETISNVMVPIDFSKHSILCLNLAMKMKELSGVNIHASHIYTVPVGFYKTGKSYEEFADIMKFHAANDYKDFLRENELPNDFPCEYILTDHESKAEVINKYAHEAGMDFILIGSHGRTATSALFIGSIVKKLLQLNLDIPMLVVKHKGENMGFFEAIMKL